MGGGTLAIADDRRQHDRAVDFAPAALAGCRGCGLENAPQILRDGHARVLSRRATLLDAAEMGRNLASEAGGFYAARAEHVPCVLVFEQCQQQVLECDFDMSLCIGIARSARERRRQLRRHRYPAQIADVHALPRTLTSFPAPAARLTLERFRLHSFLLATTYDDKA